MTKIVTDSLQPEACIVQVNTHGHALSVHLPRESVRRAFSADDSFASLCNALSSHLDLICDVAWKRFSCTQLTTISLTLDDLIPVPMVPHAS